MSDAGNRSRPRKVAARVPSVVCRPLMVGVSVEVLDNAGQHWEDGTRSVPATLEKSWPDATGHAIPALCLEPGPLLSLAGTVRRGAVHLPRGLLRGDGTRGRGLLGMPPGVPGSESGDVLRLGALGERRRVVSPRGNARLAGECRGRAPDRHHVGRNAPGKPKSPG